MSRLFPAVRRLHRSARLRIVTILLVLLTGAGIAHAEPDRLALVIGNADYPDHPLVNPVNDARAMASRLAELGFTVTATYDLRRRDIGRTIETFTSTITPGDTVVVFYAGHGMQIRGENFLPAIDASFKTEYDVTLDSISVAALLSRIDEMRAGVKILLLDACRNNPYERRTRSTATRGLARVGATAPIGTLISFATRPGGVAEDGEGGNGLYTQGLLRHIGTPGLPVEIMFKRVATAVVESSDGRQEPWVEGSIRGEFAFMPSTGNAMALAAGNPHSPAAATDTLALLDAGAIRRADVAPGQLPLKRLRSIPASGWEVLVHEYDDRVTIMRLARLPELSGVNTNAAAAATAFSCALQPGLRRDDGRFAIVGACVASDSRATIDISGNENMLRISQRAHGKTSHDLVLLKAN